METHGSNAFHFNVVAHAVHNKVHLSTYCCCTSQSVSNIILLYLCGRESEIERVCVCVRERVREREKGT